MKNRVLAAIIDGFLFLVVFILLMPSLMRCFAKDGTDLLSAIYPPFIVAFLYYFLIDFVFFTSPGKWLYNLKITTTNYQKPKRYKILLRSFMKVFVMLSGIGIIIICIALLNNHESFYDTAQGLVVSRTDI